MYEVFSEAVIVSQVAAYKAQQLPGYHGLLPLRVAFLDKNVEYVTASAQQAGTLCPACGKVLFTIEPFITVGAYWEPSRVTVSAQDLDGEQLIRVKQPQGPLYHRRCWTRGGQIRKWIDPEALSKWIENAGATYVHKNVTNPQLEVEFTMEDMPASIRAAFATTNRSLAFVPSGRN